MVARGMVFCRSQVLLGNALKTFRHFWHPMFSMTYRNRLNQKSITYILFQSFK